MLRRYFAPEPEPLEAPVQWMRLKTFLAAQQRLRFVSPSALKSTEAPSPGLLRNYILGGTPGVHIKAEATSGESVAKVNFFDPVLGDVSKLDTDVLIDLAQDSVAAGASGALVGFSRPAVEAVVVCIDVSGSMGNEAFASEKAAAELAVAQALAANRAALAAPQTLKVGDRVVSGPTHPSRKQLVGKLETKVDAGHGYSVTVAWEGFQRQTVIYRPSADRYDVVLESQKDVVRLPVKLDAHLAMSRLTVVDQLFHGYANRSAAYDYHHVVGLVSFSDVVKTACPMTESWLRFVRAVGKLKAGGSTFLWKAIGQAADMLEAFKRDQLAGVGKETKLRIICLTDGADTTHDSVGALLKRLQRQRIVCDAVVVGGEPDRRLAALARLSGGGFFRPTSMLEGLRLFESECVLSLTDRSPVSEADQNAITMAPMRPDLTVAEVDAAAAATPLSVLGRGPFVRPKLAVRRGLAPFAALRRLVAARIAAMPRDRGSSRAPKPSALARVTRGRAKQEEEQAAAAAAAAAAEAA